MYILEVHTTCDLQQLADLTRDGAKENLANAVCGANANCMDKPVQTAMAQHLHQQGFNGWCSVQNQGDCRLEVCLFYLPQGLVINKCYAYGPEVNG